MSVLDQISQWIEHIQTIFKTRELAAFIWIMISLIALQFSGEIRKPFKNLIKALFAKKIVAILLLSALYITGVIYLLTILKFWDISMLKDSILWFFGSGFIVLMSLANAEKEKEFFRKLLLGNLKLIVLFQFIVNLHVFNLTTELILLPVLTLIVLLKTYSESKSEYYKIEKLMNGILIIVGITFLIFSIIDIITDINKFASFKTLKSFLFPIILSISFVPYSYLIALFMGYETLFVRLGFYLQNKKDFRYAKWRILKLCHISLVKQRCISPKINKLYYNSTKADIKRIISV